MRGRGLGTRLAAAFAAVAALTALLAAVSVYVLWEREFESYVREGLQSRADDAATVLTSVYAQAGSWDVVKYVDLGHFGMMMSGLRLELFDEHGTLIARSQGPSVQMTPGLGPTDGEDGRRLRAGVELGSVSGPYAVSAIVVGGRQVGEVRVSPIEAGRVMSARDLAFRRASVSGVLWAAVIAVVSATIAGFLFARSIVRPVERVTDVASRLRAGDRRARTRMPGGDAVSDLGRTLDEMADAIEADREFERRLTADVAHELRTPLQAIQATVEAMQDGVLPADVERLGVVRDETVRLARLADSILELSQLEKGTAPFEMSIVDPADAVRTAVEAHRALLESAGLELSVDTGVGLRVLGDSDRLTQAVGNLLSNAARYTIPGGSVRVSVRRRSGDVEIVVSDTGMGMDASDSEHAFTRFWRADSARARSKGGVGIGLAVVKEIVERHKGRVKLESVPGKGTTVRILIPAVTQAT